MSDCRCGGKCLLPAIVGIIFGVVIGVLVNAGTIVNFLPIVWAAFGVALFAVLLFVLIVLFGECSEEKCACEHGTCLVIGAIATVLLALAILAVLPIATLVALAVLFAIGGFFFIFALVSLLQLLLCLADNACYNRE